MVVLGLTAVGAVAYTFALWTSGLQPMHGTAHFCAHLAKYDSLLYVLTYIDTIVTLVVPFIAIVVLNSSITYSVVRYHTRRRSLIADDPPDRPSSNSVSETAIKAPSTGVKRPQSHARLRTKGTSTTSVMRMTKTLVVVSSVFVLLNFPSHAIKSYMFVAEFIYPVYVPSHELQSCLKLGQLMYNLNFAINFLLYSACGSTFRHALRSLSIQIKNKVTKRSQQAYLSNRDVDGLQITRTPRLQSHTMTTEVGLPMRVTEL